MPNTKRIKTNKGGKMKIYKTQAEVEADVKDRVLKIDDDVTFDCDINIKVHIICKDLICWDLDCRNFNCRDLHCGDLICWDLHCLDIDCADLNCQDLHCRDLNYHAVAFAYKTFKCKSVKGRRKNSKHFCLDSDIIITGKQ